MVKVVDLTSDGVPDLKFIDRGGILGPDGKADAVLFNDDSDVNSDGTPNYDNGMNDSSGDKDNNYDTMWTDKDDDGEFDPDEVERIADLPPIDMPC